MDETSVQIPSRRSCWKHGTQAVTVASVTSVVRDCLKRVGHGATAPARESRRQPVPATPRLTPGRLGRCPVSQGTSHAVGPPRIICSDSL